MSRSVGYGGKMEFDPYAEWGEYQLIEEDFLRYLRYVPLVEAHENVWSASLGSILLNIGSLIDSFFKNISYEKSTTDVKNIENIRKKDRDHLNMGDYRSVYEACCSLSEKKIFELRNLCPINPFLNWGSDISPKWWKAYTDLKHDRFQNIEKGTLINVLEALGGLFLLNVMFRETISVLINNDIIRGGSFPKGTLEDYFYQTEPWQPLPIPNPIFAKTNLFGYVYETENRHRDEDEIKWIFLHHSLEYY